MANRIDNLYKLYSQLAEIKKEQDELSGEEDRKTPYSAPDSGNGSGNKRLNTDYQSTAISLKCRNKIINWNQELWNKCMI